MFYIIKNSYFCLNFKSLKKLLPNKKTTKKDLISYISSLWDLLTQEEQSYLFDQLSFKYYNKNESIYSEKDEPLNMLCLISGKAKIFKIGSSNRSQIMRVIQEGQYFGYRAYFAGERYVTNACAFENSLILQIPLNCVQNVIVKNVRLACFFVKLLSIDLGISDRRSITLTQCHIRGRLAETLLFLKESYGLEEDGATLSIYLSREDISALSNMTTANAIRTLSNFASEKLIAIDGRKIKLIDEVKLRRIAQIG